MDPLVLVLIPTFIVIVAALVYFLKFAGPPGRGVNDEHDVIGADVGRGPRGVLVARRAVAARAGPRRRGVNVPRAAPQDSDEEEGVEEAEVGVDKELLQDGKVGAKKQRKLEEKAERRAQREAELEEREERKKQEEEKAKLRKKEELKKEKEEAAKAAEEQKLKEERERQEHEEYLKMKAEFSIESSGTDAQDELDVQSLLQEFINHIKQKKVVMLEDLASHFKIKTQDAIDRIKTLQEDGSLSGVIDDRGKFVYITTSEYEAVARFIKQRGRVTISELAESMNRLINLNPESNTKLDSVFPASINSSLTAVSS